MSTDTVVRHADLPGVNLIPNEIQEARDFQRLQIGLGAVVVLSLLGVGGFYVQGRSGVQDARAALDQAQANVTSAQRQLHSLDYVKTEAANVQSAEDTLRQVRSVNVHWSDTLDSLSLELPANVWYTSVNITESAGPASYSAGASVPDVIGQISFQGYGRSQNDVAAWLDATSKVPFFSNQTFSTATEQLLGDTPVVQFASTVAVTKDALSACDEPGVC